MTDCTFSHSLDAARIKAHHDLDLGLSQLRTREQAIVRMRQELDRAEADLRQLGIRLSAHFSIPVNYVAGINFAAELHQRVSDLRRRSRQLEGGLQVDKTQLKLIWRRVKMLDEHRAEELREFRAQALQRVAAEFDAVWAAREAWRKGAA